MERDEVITGEAAAAGSGAGVKLALGTALCLGLAGGLLWWREGGEVFSRLVTTAFAWCF